MQVTGFDFVAGTYFAADSVIGLTGKKCFVDGFTLLLGSSVDILLPTFSYRACMDFPQVAQ